VTRDTQRNTLTADALRGVAGSTATLLHAKVVTKGDIAGWHNNFAPDRIGSTGSALPLAFLRDQKQITPSLEKRVIAGLLRAQFKVGADRGGWAILSISGCPTVEGTAPTLGVLAQSSGFGVADAVALGRAWLLEAQNPDGGWGSNQAAPSRTSLTASAVSTLSSLDVPDAEALDRAISWFRTNQQATGAWAEAPGRDGTVVHTALALRALVSAGMAPDDRPIASGLSYIQQYWRPDSGAISVESYDCPVPEGYNKVALQHDVDAQVVLTLLMVDPWGLSAPLWDTAAAWVKQNSQGKWWEHHGGEPTLWTIVPRATAASALARRLPSSSSTVRWRRGTVAVCISANRWPLVQLTASTFRFIPANLRWPAVFTTIGVSVLFLVLWATPVWTTDQFFNSAIVPGILLVAQLFIQPPQKATR
jgi:hypothetical protein